MSQANINPETEQLFTALTERVHGLIQQCHALADENSQLQQHCVKLQAERQSLIEQNEQSRARIDAMVSRLKVLEQAS